MKQRKTLYSWRIKNKTIISENIDLKLWNLASLVMKETILALLLMKNGAISDSSLIQNCCELDRFGKCLQQSTGRKGKTENVYITRVT